MPKSTGGGGGSSIFTSNVTGDGSVAIEAWVQLVSVPVGKKIWFGTGQYSSPDKSITFELRVNTTGQSAGSDGATLLLASTAVSARSGTVTADYYKNGRLHLVSPVGTGVEKCWLKLKSKGSAGSYLYSVNFTEE